MKKANKNTNGILLSQIEMREQILHSMVASFKIEGIDISEQSAREIFEKVKSKLN